MSAIQIVGSLLGAAASIIPTLMWLQMMGMIHIRLPHWPSRAEREQKRRQEEWRKIHHPEDEPK